MKNIKKDNIKGQTITNEKAKVEDKVESEKHKKETCKQDIKQGTSEDNGDDVKPEDIKR